MAEIIQYITLANGDMIPFSVMKDDIYLDTKYSVEDIIHIIQGEVITPRFRIFVLYPDETISYEIPIEDIQIGGSYSENYQDGQRRSISFTLFNEDGRYNPDINTLWTGTKLRLEMGIEMFDNTTIWFQKGVYIITQSNPSKSVSGKALQVTANDKFCIFEDKTGTLADSLEIPVGSVIEDVIKDVLLYDKGDGYPYDSKPIIYHSSFKGKTVQSTISKSAGDTWGSVLTELATQLSAEIFYNSVGNLVLIPTSETTDDGDKPLLYEFVSDNGDIDSLSFTFNMNEIINYIIVTGSSVNGAVYKATAQNDDPASPLCVQRIGRRIGGIINDSNITSDILAQERADYELRKQLVIKSSVSTNVIFNPLLEVNNLISIDDDFFELHHERFLLQGVSCSLDYSGSMNMTISNIKNLPFIV